MNANREAVFNELTGYAANIAEATGWDITKSWRHVLDFHPHKFKALAAKEVKEQQKREKQNPEETLMETAQSQYEKDSSQPKVKIYSQLLRNNPEIATRADAKVKGYSVDALEAKREFEADVIRRAREYMKAHPEATRLQAHKAVRDEILGRDYQAEGVEIVSEGPVPPEVTPDLSGDSFQMLGSVINSLRAKNDMSGAVAWARSYRGGRVAEEAAALWSIRKGKERAQALGTPGLSSMAESFARQQLLREFPEIAAMIRSGRGTTERALEVMYPTKAAA